MESFEIEKYYEWVTSQRKGRVEIYLAEDDNNVYFKSGRFIQKDLFESSLMEINESTYKEKENFSEPAPTPPPQTADDWETMLGNPQPTSIAPPTPKVEKEKSPISIILERQKKFSTEIISIDYKLNMPNPKAIEFMTMMFDEEEVIEEISNFMISQISQEQAKKLLKESIKEKIIGFIISSDSLNG